MSATAQAPRPALLNRRRRVRQKIHAPAYATFRSASRSDMLDLCEVLDISEVGVAVQSPSPMEIGRQVDLCLDLSEATGQVSASARVVWSDSGGRVGLALPPLTNADLHRLREWLFLNAMAGAANAGSSAAGSSNSLTSSRVHSELHFELQAEVRPTYTDSLTAASAVQREAESLGTDLEAVLFLIASRSQSLLRASGAAIALAGKDDRTMICRASAGPSAPPVGAALQIGSGFSGECVRTGKTSRCDDAETDERVDRESCRALGIRSMLATPVCLSAKVIGLLEVFSAVPGAFTDNDSAVLQRFAETILAAIHRAARTTDPFVPTPPKPFTPSPGSILFAQAPAETTERQDASAAEEDDDKAGGIRLPRAHLYLLICAAVTICFALGFLLAPWLQQKLQARERSGEQTVLASSRPPNDASNSASSGPSVDSANLEQLREMAQHGDAGAEDKLGRLYAEGDQKQGLKPDDAQAAHWFTSAAEHGSVSAQYKLGLLYWGGHHGLPKDTNKAYFWTVLARAGGQPDGKDLAKLLANGMTRAQSTTIEQQAEIWYRQHESQAKPNPGH
jgi:putative methionine-R-sulfoxide reductase with GAF domain